MEQEIDHFGKQQACENRGAGPSPGSLPSTLRHGGVLAQVEHHYDENKENHDRARINDHFECGDKRSPQSEKHNRDGEQ